MLSSNVLVLNQSYLPVDVTTVRRAFTMLYQGIVKAVDEQYATFDFKSWSELSVAAHHDSVGLVDRLVRVPRVVLLGAYDRIPKRQIRFSRHNIFLRDNSSCQYCGQHLPRKELNLDHVVPRSMGGMTTWENVVTSCFLCNRRKGGHLLKEVGMRVLAVPKRPRWTPLRFSLREGRYREWFPYLNEVDFSYWNVELDQE